MPKPKSSSLLKTNSTNPLDSPIWLKSDLPNPLDNPTWL